MDQPKAPAKPPAAEGETVNISTPANDGDTFTGSARGNYSPNGSSVTCGFWR